MTSKLRDNASMIMIRYGTRSISAENAGLDNTVGVYVSEQCEHGNFRQLLGKCIDYTSLLHCINQY